MSTREEVAAAYSAHMSAFAQRLVWEPFRSLPQHRATYDALLAAEEAACKEYERLAAEEEPQDPPPTPDLRSDEDREIDAAISDELALEGERHDHHWTQGGTKL